MEVLNSLKVGLEMFKKNMDWVKMEETTGKVEPYAKFLEEEKSFFQRVIFTFVSEANIVLDFELNLN